MIFTFMILWIFYDLINKKYQKCHVCKYPAKINSKECPRCGTTLKEISDTWDHPETLSTIQKWSVRKRILIGSGLLVFGSWTIFHGINSNAGLIYWMTPLLFFVPGIILVINGLSHHYQKQITPHSLEPNTKRKTTRTMIIVFVVIVIILTLNFVLRYPF